MSWSRFFRRSHWDEERAREIDAYIEFETAENVARGMAAEEARYVAIRKFGNPTLVREEIYRMNSIGFIETLWQDLRYGARGLRLSPGFAVVAIVSLALGIGANTAIFQLFDAVRLRLLPVKDPQQLVDVKLASGIGDRGPSDKVGRHSNLTYAVWEQIRAHQQVFSGVAAWSNSSFNLAPRGEARNVEGLYVSGDFFRVLGVRPVLGRVFSAADDRRGCGSPGAVISDAFWQREYGGKTRVVGRKLTLNGHPFDIIGIMPASFFGVDVGHQFDVAVPICSEPLLEPAENAVNKRTYWWLAVLGRLKRGVSMPQASAQLKVISSSIFQATVPVYNPQDVKGYLNLQLEADPAGNGLSSIRGRYEAPLILLLSIAGLVLLIACANLANLMLARASTREREIAVRLALGASRRRLIFQLLSESLLLAFSGAALGIALARVSSRFLVLFINVPTDPIFLNISPDWRVLGFTTALAVLTCLLFGLTPALRATHIEPSAAMKAGGRGLSASRERFGLRRFLVVSQVALSLVLLTGALLFVRSLDNLLTVDAGFQENGILIANLDMSRLGFSATRQRVMNEELLTRLRHVTGVESAAMFSNEPAGGNNWNELVMLEGKENQKKPIYFDRVSDGYFRTLSIPRIAGRDFNEDDTPTSPKVAIVNEAFARKYARGANPIGMRFRIEGSPGEPEPFYQIVGLVKDTKYLNLRQEFVPIIYESESQRADPDSEPSFFIHSSLPSLNLISSVKKAADGVEPNATMSFGSFKTDIRERLLPERLMATLSSFFGFLAAVLATVGLYGVMAYMVARRRNEIGIRMALGADQVAVVSMVLREAAGLLVIGLAVGIGLTLIAARGASSLLFGVPSWDPVSLSIAVASLAVIGLVASSFPAARAARLNPMAALREE